MSKTLMPEPALYCKYDELVAAGALKPHPDNAHRSHPERQLERYRSVIAGNGWRKAVVVSKRSGCIVKGHGAARAAAAAGWRVPVEYQDYESLAEERRDLIADNRLAQDAVTDEQKLAALLSEMDAPDVELTGYGKKELDELISRIAPKSEADAEPQIDKAEELRKKWGVERGQVWELGEHRLMCGDCTKDNILNGDKLSALVTDPPYGMDLDTDWSGIQGTGSSLGFKKKIKGKAYRPVIGDDKPFDAGFLFDTWDAPEMFLFGADYYSDTIPSRTAGSWVVWDKRKESQADGFGSEFELIWSKTKHKRRILRHEWFGFLREGEHGEARTHPTQKSVALIADIIGQWCGEIIGDPFSGVGTTLIACEQLNRKCRAMEIDPGYVAVSLQRWADATGKTPKLVS